MTEQPTTPEDVATADTQPDDAVDTQHDNNVEQPDEQHDDAEQADERDQNPNAEAAKYRRRLRETEAERDTLSATVERLQRSEVERLLADRLSQPGDIFDIGKVTLSDLLNEEGHVEPALVDTALHGLLEQRPGLAKPPLRQKFPSGIGLGDRGPGPRGTSWEEAFEQALKH